MCTGSGTRTLHKQIKQRLMAFVEVGWERGVNKFEWGGGRGMRRIRSTRSCGRLRAGVAQLRQESRDVMGPKP